MTGNPKMFRGECKVIHLEIDPAEIDKIVHADVAVYSHQTSYNKTLWNSDYTAITGYEINQATVTHASSAVQTMNQALYPV